MRKMAIFNVGDALCAFADIDGVRVLIDCGKNDDFNPVKDFLIPLAELNNWLKSEGEKYDINQLLVSHPHHDHISAIEDFNDSFHPGLLTCPTDIEDTANGKPFNPKDKINWDEFEQTDQVKTLRNMMKGRNLPLRVCVPTTATDSQYLYYLHPKDVEEDSDLCCESYANNISLVTLFSINGHHVLFPGDIQKEGMKRLFEENPSLVKELNKHRLCILIAPHHGLKSAFSVELFEAINKNKTRCLNVISEKPNNPEENRDVDSRYASSDYCDGDNNLESCNGACDNCQRKTSQGHICIDFSNGSRPDILILKTNEELLDFFTE